MECKKCGCKLNDKSTYCIRCGYNNIDEYINEELGINPKDIKFSNYKENKSGGNMKFHNFLVGLYFIVSVLFVILLFFDLSIATISGLIISSIFTFIMYKRKFIAWFLIMATSLLGIAASIVAFITIMINKSMLLGQAIPLILIGIILNYLILKYYFRRKKYFY